MFERELRRAAELLSQSDYAVALTGAGVSTPSGIPDFRSPDSGLWNHVDPFRVASLAAFRRDPKAFYDWLRPLAGLVRDAQPNPAHLALARLEALGVVKAVITQNIDRLHHKAGSVAVHEVHGNLSQATCLCCYAEYAVAPYLDGFIHNGDIPHCPTCGCALKPNVILFGEQLPANVYTAAHQAARRCDAMLVAGSSLEVEPVGGLPRLAALHQARLIVVNYQRTHVDHLAEVVIHDDVAAVLPRIVDVLDEIRQGTR